MDRDTEIKKGLAAAGVPRAAMATTLPALGQAHIREDIKNKVFFADDPRGAWVYGAPETANKTRQVFQVMAKEMYLTGTTVQCISLIQFGAMLVSEEGLSESVERAKMLFLLDFYEAGCPRPLNDETFAQLRFWVRSRFEQGMAISFLSDAPLAQADWWPTSLRSFLSARVNEYNVEAA